ncbi:MAG: ROK family protein [Nocardioidaceae bacterium]|nr:ROK family protein [Nocardioidaceae bacterium]NUS49467.1 ROK family protein [Nocardioidaceae bacterium]
MLVLARGRFGSAPARVLQQVRRHEALTREELVRLTGLSPATVARTTTTLVDECLLRERPDLARPGAVGRPGVPLEIDPGRHSVLGVHVGKRVTTVGLVGLDGRVVAQSRFRTRGDLAELAARAVRHANALVAGSLERTVLAGGLVAPWDEVPYDEHELAAVLAERAGLEIGTANHVAAVAAAEYLGRRRTGDRCTAYVYVRETAGFALANDLRDRTEISRVASLTHLPTGSDAGCGCGRSGCFVATAGDEAVARQAVELGIVDEPDVEWVLVAARAGDAAADALLRRRAAVLGATTAVLRDMIAPDNVVLVGQAFTGYPPAVADIVAAFDAATTLSPMELSITRFGTGVQAAAAGTVALGTFYEDPLGLLDRPMSAAPVDADLDSASC